MRGSLTAGVSGSSLAECEAMSRGTATPRLRVAALAISAMIFMVDSIVDCVENVVLKV